MTSSSRVQALMFASLVLAAVACLGPETEITVDRVAEEILIHELLDEVRAAANERDADRTVATYTADGDIWIAGGPWVRGPAEIRQFEEEFYRTPGYVGWDVEIESIRFLADNAAIVEASSKTMLEDSEMDEKATLVVVREDRTWKIAAVRLMSITKSH